MIQPMGGPSRPIRMQARAALVGLGLMLCGLAPRVARADSAACTAVSSVCPARAALALPMDPDGTALQEGFTYRTDRALGITSLHSFMAGDSFPTRSPYVTHTSLFFAAGGAQLALGIPLRPVPAGVRDYLAFSSYDVRFKGLVWGPTSGEYGGLHVGVVGRLTLPVPVEDPGAGQPMEALDTRVVVGYRYGLAGAQVCLGVRWVEDAPSHVVWSVPFGVALQVNLLPLAAAEDVHLRLFFEGLGHFGSGDNAGFVGAVAERSGVSIKAAVGGGEIDGPRRFMAQVAFGYVLGVGDLDGDGITDDQDDCRELPGPRAYGGCPRASVALGPSKPLPAQVAADCSSPPSLTFEGDHLDPDSITSLGAALARDTAAGLYVSVAACDSQGGETTTELDDRRAEEIARDLAGPPRAFRAQSVPARSYGGVKLRAIPPGTGSGPVAASGESPPDGQVKETAAQQRLRCQRHVAADRDEDSAPCVCKDCGKCIDCNTCDLCKSETAGAARSVPPRELVFAASVPSGGRALVRVLVVPVQAEDPPAARPSPERGESEEEEAESEEGAESGEGAQPEEGRSPRGKEPDKR